MLEDIPIGKTKQRKQVLPAEYLPPECQVFDITPKEVAFLDALFSDPEMSPGKAYLTVYHPSTQHMAFLNREAQQLLRRKNMLAAYQHRMSKRKDNAIITEQFLLFHLRQNIERCAQAEPVMEFNRETKKFEPTGEYKFEPGHLNKAIELAGKHLGMFKDTLELSTKDNKPLHIINVTMTVEEAKQHYMASLSTPLLTQADVLED